MDRIMKTKGMKLDKNKITIMVANINKNTNPLDLNVRRVQIKEVEKFKCLHGKIT